MNVHRSALRIIAAAMMAVASAVARADANPPELAKYDKRVDESIDKALACLARNQMVGTLPHEPLTGSFKSGMPGNTGVSSLCVLAFLSKGNTPGTGRYGEVINKGIDYILSRQQPNGMLVVPGDPHGPMYCHCISTLMLCEVSGMVDAERQKKIDVVLPKALKLILDAQRVPKAPEHAGGWRYEPTSQDSDLSLTGWAVMALRAARLNGAAVPKDAIDNAVKYIMSRRMPDGRFDYQPRSHQGVALTGTAVLCLELCGRHGDEATRSGGEFILKHLPNSIQDDLSGIGGTTRMFFYGVYHCSQAMFQLGGKYWEVWAPRMYDVLLPAQQPDGSWPPDMYQVTRLAGPAYSTSMAVLAMAVVYHQLPIYQR